MSKIKTIKPTTELLLSELEEEYLKKRDVVTYQKIFSELLPYARSLILKKTTGKIFLQPSLVEDASLEATVKFMSQYEKPEYRTHSSFAGLLNYKILESLYGPRIKNADKVASLNEHIENNKNRDTELGDLPENYNFTYMFRPYDSDICDDPANYLFNRETDAIHSLLSVIKDLYKAVNLHQFYVISIAIQQFIDHSKTLEKFKELFFTPEMEEVYDISLLEIRNRLNGVA